MSQMRKISAMTMMTSLSRGKLPITKRRTLRTLRIIRMTAKRQMRIMKSQALKKRRKQMRSFRSTHMSMKFK